MSDKPDYRDRYPCAACGCGYLDCADYALTGQKCCADCDGHPERWDKGRAAYTDAEYDDMWARAGRPRPVAADFGGSGAGRLPIHNPRDAACSEHDCGTSCDSLTTCPTCSVSSGAGR